MKKNILILLNFSRQHKVLSVTVDTLSHVSASFKLLATTPTFFEAFDNLKKAMTLDQPSARSSVN
jgi:hypothetical protein